jgi:hypothetical protein
MTRALILGIVYIAIGWVAVTLLHGLAGLLFILTHAAA